MGTREQFHPQGRALAARGMTCFFVDYRVKDRHGTTPVECVDDALDAMKWVVDHASEYDIDPSRIVAAGGSAGGHLAACTAYVSGDHARPCALVLFNPAVDFVSFGRFFLNDEKEIVRISPLAQLNGHPETIVPAILFHGDADTTVPIAGSEASAAATKQAGRESSLVVYPGEQHGFFNWGVGDGSAYESTLGEAIAFLDRQGLLLPSS